MYWTDRDFLTENRECEITLIFENILRDLWYSEPLEIQSIERAILTPEWKIISENFFKVVHSDLEKQASVIKSIRAIILTVNWEKILIAHEAKNTDDISHINTRDFQRVITAEDVLNTGNTKKFQWYVREIIQVERDMRENQGIPSTGRDRLSRERIQQLLEGEVEAE